MSTRFFRALVRSLTDDREYYVISQPQYQYQNSDHYHSQSNCGPFAGPPPTQYIPPQHGSCGPQPAFGLDGRGQQYGPGNQYQNGQQHNQQHGQYQSFRPEFHNASSHGGFGSQPVPQGPPPPYSPTPAQATRSPAASTRPPSPGVSGPQGSPSCSGSETAMRESYCSALTPGFDVCVSCYDTHISQTCLANRFNKVPHPPGFQGVCDMSLRAIRDAWANTCLRAATSQSVQDQNVWLDHFQRQHSQIGQRLSGFIAQRDSLSSETTLLAAQAERQRAIGLSQRRFALNSEMAASIPGYTRYGDTSTRHNVGSASMADSLRTRQEIATKKAQIRDLQAQIMAIVS